MIDAVSDELIVAAKDQVFCSLAEESVILNLKSGMYYGLDPVGSFVWKLIQTERDLREIRDLILEEYDVEPERCEQDLVELLNDFSAQGLVEIKEK
jgi:hypothetical protein